ncbi:MAG: hypothetical protein ACSLE7_17150 [Mycobacterium sp.]
MFEINEVPFQVIDDYCTKRPASTLARVLSRSRQYETFTEDSLALDPWISWPTMHRGVPDTQHQILHLGQVLDEVDAQYPPIWRLLKQGGVSVGVFGSLHSSSVPQDAAEYSFYVPDCFDNEVFAQPKILESFQEFNLRMTRDSARNVSRNLPIGVAAKFAVNAPALGLKASTTASVVRHLARESRNKDLRIRRRNFQPLLAADLFMKQVRKTRPQFATFYSNNVAAAMHRYWGAAFPEEYAEGTLDAAWVEKYGGELSAAMDAFDQMLEKFVSFVDANSDYTLVIAGSMGQSSIETQHTYEFLTIADLGKFLTAMGVPEESWEIRPAMIPCRCAVVPASHRAKFLENLAALKIDGHSMVESLRPLAPMSFDEREQGFFQLFVSFDNFVSGAKSTLHGEEIAPERLGLGMIAHEDGVNCTAQHVPEGAMIVYSSLSREMAMDNRHRVSTVEFVPSMLRHFNIAAPDYMHRDPKFYFETAGDVSVN